MDGEINKSEWAFFVTTLVEEARESIWKVGSDADPKSLIDGIKEELQGLARKSDGADLRTDEEIWMQVKECIHKAAYDSRPYCIKCGTCCTIGSPTLLKSDFELFDKGVLKPTHLVTLRKGEKAYDPKSEEVIIIDDEMIKLREKDGTKTCIFYDPTDQNCSIYQFRPVQCRKQECWDAQRKTDVAGVPLSREDLLKPVSSLWDVISRHEERCSHAQLQRSVARLAATGGQSIDEFIDLLRFDMHVRDFIGEQLGLTPESVDFFLGRPLKEFLTDFGLALDQKDDGSFFLSPLEE
jgi:Fe-S-cluster containining protein